MARKPFLSSVALIAFFLIAPAPSERVPAHMAARQVRVADQDSAVSPVIDASTFLGGDGGDEIDGIAVDSAGNVYVAGTTNSGNLPVTSAAFQKTTSGTRDHVFVAKLNPAGTAILYLTYLGGSGSEQATAIAVDASGSAYVVGTTDSRDFPVTPGAAQTQFGGAGILGDAFITKLDPTGSHLLYSTYLGGSGDEAAAAVAIDATGDVFVAGSTRSANFPVTPGAFQTKYSGGGNVSGSGGDGFVAELDPSGSTLLYSTYIGGSKEDTVLAIALAPNGETVVAGGTNSSNFPVTLGALQKQFGGSAGDVDTEGDAFIAELNPLGTGLIFSTFLGGAGADVASSVELDSLGNICVQGNTSSRNFPLYQPVQAVLAGKTDGFLSKLNPAGTILLYSTYFGGSDTDSVSGTVDPSGFAYVSGSSSSANFPLLNAFQPFFGNSDAVIAKFDPNGALLYSTYLGGGDSDFGGPIARDSSGTIWVGGSTFSQNFPVMNALQPSQGGGMYDAFLTRIVEIPTPPANEQADLMVTLTPDRSSISNGDTLTYALKVTNNGPSMAEEALLIELIPSPLNLSSASASAGSCSGSPYVSCSLGSLATGQSATATIVATVPSSSGISMGGPLVATADVISATADPNLGNNSAQATVSLTIHGGGTHGGGGSGGSGCFIATAAYGSYLDPHVYALRQFRDRHLLTNALGRRFVRSYYRYSPAVAALLDHSAALRTLTRVVLSPIVFAIEYPIRAAFAILLVFGAILMLGPKLRRGVRRGRWS
jgi:uncharacterized repeat protein (TIGR01451 family)